MAGYSSRRAAAAETFVVAREDTAGRAASFAALAEARGLAMRTGFFSAIRLGAAVRATRGGWVRVALSGAALFFFIACSSVFEFIRAEPRDPAAFRREGANAGDRPLDHCRDCN